MKLHFNTFIYISGHNSKMNNFPFPTTPKLSAVVNASRLGLKGENFTDIPLKLEVNTDW
jgi:hypothetical protein